MRRTLYSLLAILVLTALVVAGCGTTAPAAPAEQPAAEQPAAEEAAPAEEAAAEEPAASEAVTDTAAAEEPAAEEPTAVPEPTPLPTPIAGRTQVRWFIGLGTGTGADQIPTEQAVVDAFNASQDKIQLIAEIVDYNAARDVLSTQLAAGNPPDIVGPMGFTGANGFYGQWLDLTDLIAANNYDLGQYGEAAVEFFRTDEGQVGIPFASFPSMLFFQRDMFDEAGLNYPPQEYGKPYVWPDGTEEEWNFDTMTKVAKMLTVDTNGASVLEVTDDGSAVPVEGFDPASIVQYGYINQYQDPRASGSHWGAGRLVADDGKTAQIPEQWAAAWAWLFDGMWGDEPFIPSGPVFQSPDFGSGNPFNSGKVGMAITHLWYTCCINDAGSNWDIAAIPSHNGVVTANLNADTFRIHKDSKVPQEAFEAMTYLLGEGSLDLLSVYGGMPARTADQAEFLANLDAKYPQGVNWDVAQAGFAFPDIPSAEAYMPNYLKAFDRLKTFQTLMENDGTIDIAAETDALKADLQTVYDEVAE